MYHHADSPEVIHAHLAEWERTVAAHTQRQEAARLQSPEANPADWTLIRSLLARLQHVFRPASRMHEQSTG